MRARGLQRLVGGCKNSMAGFGWIAGVVEAGCKMAVGQRLKQSGMLWSLEGASHLLTVRCALLSRWFETFWKHYSTGRALFCDCVNSFVDYDGRQSASHLGT